MEFVRKLIDRYHEMPPLVQMGGPMLAYIVGEALIPVLLFMYSEELGVWWFILLLIYVITLGMSIAWLLRKKEMRQVRGEFGDEFYYNAYPKERIKDERRRQREEKRKALSAEKAE